MIGARVQYILIFWWLLPYISVRAEPTVDTIKIGAFADRFSIRKKALLLATPPNATLAQIQRSGVWQSIPEGFQTHAHQAYWLKFILHNDIDTTKQLFFYTSNANQVVQLYVQHSDSMSTLQSGTMVATPYWASQENDLYIPLTLAPRITLQGYIRVANVQGWLPRWTTLDVPKPSVSIFVEQEAYHYKRTQAEIRRNFPEFSYRSWIQGALGFCLFFVGLIYWRYRLSIYRYYFLYILGAFVFAILKTRTYTPLGHWLSYFPLLRTHLLEVAMWGSLAAYLFFLNELLDLNRLHTPTYRWFSRIGWLLAGYGLFYGCVMLLTNDGGFQQLTYWIVRLIAFPLNIGIIGWIAFKIKSPLSKYVVWGNVLMVLVGTLAWLRGGEILLKGIKLPASLDDLFTVSFGVLLEILVFSLALAHRIKLIDDERQNNQMAYISELEQKTSYEKRLAEIEMLALRSQMNPHFLFNSLNSLEYFILAGKEQKATQYLSKFSRLLRLILNHSREKTITLAEELTALRLYLEIEATRFGDDFQYKIEIPQHIDQEQVIIPPLLLQPFVENAIWHGLMQSKQADKILHLQITSHSENLLLMEIQDNGIGRKQAAHLKTKSVMKQKSHGVAITNQRVELFNRNYPSQISIEVIDLQQHKQTGTLIKIWYQLEGDKHD